MRGRRADESERGIGSAAWAAALGAAVIVAPQVAAKATREALFFSSFPATSLPLMTIAAALFSMAFVLLTCRAMIDYVFKAQVQEAAAYAQEGLPRFYAAVSLIAFVIHVAVTRLLLEWTALPATALAVGCSAVLDRLFRCGTRSGSPFPI